MIPFFFDPTMIILIPAILLAMYAQMKVKSTFNKYLQVNARSGMTGAEVAQRLLNKQGISNVRIQEIRGNLSDHYDPRSKVLNLSSNVYRGSSLASIGVAAHETGHAIQHHLNYMPLRIRHALVPVASFGSQTGPLLAAFGFFFFRSEFLVTLGLVFFIGAVLFQIVTLPVEFNASSRALRLLREHNFLANDEVKGARKVLSAAALTYVAATLVAIGHLIRLLVMKGMLNDD